ncbi:electron transfer flavoprotein subunit beta/FixA family protein [Catenisphaera adipataccumulans]|jgi:electron transfer flavoprotein beta subunit|uniref:Electron transfer flavoprotein small subunit n=1 Tax=Catenisphaera adipataccumulans TaxID=700500 RepID=A0A7W8CZL5_9FIRM|nr:electron transfer flavoprotein subunit beta/FixA family protein [Catenisphaera adipataccumulans]MBB5183272.1 electron transfer flavoprotein beta subunit [Catenisphaera adipataccumulans]
MKIIVLEKQVPDSTEISVDKKTGTLIREGVPSITNPDDMAGLEAALQIKDKNPDTEITVMTMGIPKAKGMLEEGIARGADKGVLITDRAFAGADTCATSRTLADAINKVGYDIVFAGRQAIDGDTAQVGPQTAERLGVPQVTYVDEILDVKEDQITVKKSLEDVEQVVTVKLPCLLTFLSDSVYKPRYMNCNDIVDLQKEDKVQVLTNGDLNMDPSLIGLAGSPTSVKRTFTKDVSDKTETFTLSEQETADMIAKTLKEKQIITK